MSDVVRFSCPACGKKLTTSASRAGRQGKCPSCGRALVVPSVSGNSGASNATQPSPTRPARVRPPEKPSPPRRGLAVAALGVVLIGAGVGVWLIASGQFDEDPPIPVASHQSPNRPILNDQSPIDNSNPAPVDPINPQPVSEIDPRPANTIPPEPETITNSGPAPPVEPNSSLPAAEPMTPAMVPATPLTGAELQDALAKGLTLEGTLTPEYVTEGFYPNTTQYHQWLSDLTLKNTSNIHVPLGTDFLLIELDTNGASYDGFALFNEEPSTVDPSTYGLGRNHEIAGQIINEGGGMIRITYGGGPGDPFGIVAPGKSWSLTRGFPQFSWVYEDVRSSVCVVLPEFQVKGTDGLSRFRLMVYFEKSRENDSWIVDTQRLILLEPDGLSRMLTDPSSNMVTRVLAANWLVERFPEAAPAPLIKTATPLLEGQLLGSCLELLTLLKAKGLESHAAELVQNQTLPNGIRAWSAEYLGAVGHAPSLALLKETTADVDSVVVNGAITGLGWLGGQEAIDALAAILNNPDRFDYHSSAANSLARTKAPEAIRLLQDLATRPQDPDVGFYGSSPRDVAMQALIDAGNPDTFDFFVRLAESNADPTRRDSIARGLASTGGDKAVPILMQMLKDAAPPTEAELYGDGLVDVFVGMDNPKITPDLAELARIGNVRAARILARSYNDSVREPLTELAGQSTGDVLVAVVEGLANNWAQQSVAVFAKALTNADARIVRAAIQGVQYSNDKEALALLLPILEHTDPDARSNASWAIRELAPKPHVPKLVEIFLKTSDSQVISACAELLIAGEWKDASAIPNLVEKLQTVNEFERYNLIRLLRHLSGNAMGPKDENEWYEDPEGWYNKWVDWARQQSN